MRAGGSPRPGEETAVRRRHTEYFCALAEDADRRLPVEGGSQVLRLLEPEADELRAAVDWSLASGDLHTALRLGGSLGWFWFASRRGEGTDRLNAILATAPPEPTRERARVLQAAGLMSVWPPTGRGLALAREALAIFERLGDERGAAVTKVLVGGTLATSGGEEEAARLLAEAEASFSARGDRWYEGLVWRVRSWGALARGDLETAITLGRRSLERYRELDDAWGVASVLGQLGVMAMRLGDYRWATELYGEALDLARRVGLFDAAHMALSELGTLAALRGDGDRSVALHEEALAIARSMGSRAGVAHTYNGMGLSARLDGDLARARELHSRALDLYRELGAVGGVAFSLCCLGFTAELADDLDTAERRHLEALDLTLAHRGDYLSPALALEGVAGVAAARGEADRAALLLGAADAARARGGSHLPEPERFDVDRAVAKARSHLGERGFSALFGEGARLDLQAAAAVARREPDADRS